MEVTIDNRFIPYPLEQLKFNLRKKHDKSWVKIDQLIEDYVKSNGTGYLKLSNLLVKQMESELSFTEISKSDEEDFKAEIDKLDERFKPIDDLLQNLSPQERRGLFLKRYESMITSLSGVKKAVLKAAVQKEEWSELDPLIYGYFEYFLGFMQTIVKLLSDVPNEKIDETIAIFGIAVALYGAVFLGYSNNTLSKDNLNARMSEISTIADPAYKKVPKKVTRLVEKSLEVAPCPK